VCFKTIKAMKKFGIFGTSGFAREVGDIACELGFQPLYVARDLTELQAWDYSSEIIVESDLDRYSDIHFAIGIGDNAVREKVAKRYAGQLSFANLIHPSATFGQCQRLVIEARIGVVVCAGVRMTNNIQIGDFVIFNLNSTIGHDVIVDDFVNIAPGVSISGNVHLRSRCSVGTGAVVNQGSGSVKLHIGEDTIIGSGSVVVKNCESHATYVGIPAKRIK
jgi:sugar O-acyltransferase (sialic acid O-acetyltransferase NeuD family)